MSGEAVFARKASGLVREAGLLDTSMLSIAMGACTVSAWYYTSTAPFLFPGANHLLTYIIGTILGIAGWSFMWGILGGSMPRSGGDYVINSRIIHPIIGLGESMANTFSAVIWTVLGATWVIDPGLSMLIGAAKIPSEAIGWCISPSGMFVLATIINITGFIIVMFGLRKYLFVQRVMMFWGLIATAMAAIIFMATPHAKFVEIWNYYAEQYNSISWDTLLTSVQQQFTIPAGWNWTSTIGCLLPLSWGMIYIYVLVFIGGEVKNPRRNMFLSSIVATLVTVFFMGWVALSLEHMVGRDGWHALSYLELVGVEGYNFPFPPSYPVLASMVTHFNRFVGLFIGLGFMFQLYLICICEYVLVSRVWFAWGMDGAGPTWFTDIHPRFRSPIKLLSLLFILSEAGITLYVIRPAILAGFSVEVLQLVSVFLITSISCTIFPYRKRVKDIWEASPYKHWKVGPIPYATIAGLLSMVFVLICIWANFYTAGMAALNIVWTPIYIGVWIFGILWYYIWKWHRKKQGIDITLAYRELAPE